MVLVASGFLGGPLTVDFQAGLSRGVWKFGGDERRAAKALTRSSCHFAQSTSKSPAIRCTSSSPSVGCSLAVLSRTNTSLMVLVKVSTDARIISPVTLVTPASSLSAVVIACIFRCDSTCPRFKNANSVRMSPRVAFSCTWSCPSQLFGFRESSLVTTRSSCWLVPTCVSANVMTAEATAEGRWTRSYISEARSSEFRIDGEALPSS